MSGKIWIINLFLAAVVSFLGLKTYEAWSEAEKPLPEMGGGKASAPVGEKTAAKADVPPVPYYQSVVSNNLFSLSRLPDEEEKKATEEKAKPKPDEKLIKLLEETVKRISIYGIMMVDEEKRALVKTPAMSLLGKPVNAQQTPRSGEDIKWVKVGETVDRFTVNEIKSTGVVLGAEGLEFDVALFDKDKPKERVSEKKMGGPVVIQKDEVKGQVPEKKGDVPVEVGKEGGRQPSSPPERATTPTEKGPVKIPIEPGQARPPEPGRMTRPPEPGQTRSVGVGQ